MKIFKNLDNLSHNSISVKNGIFFLFFTFLVPLTAIKADQPGFSTQSSALQVLGQTPIQEGQGSGEGGPSQGSSGRAQQRNRFLPIDVIFDGTAPEMAGDIDFDRIAQQNLNSVKIKIGELVINDSIAKVGGEFDKCPTTDPKRGGPFNEKCFIDKKITPLSADQVLAELNQKMKTTVNPNEVKPSTLLNRNLSKCNEIQKIFEKVKHFGTDGAGADGDSIVAEGIWKYCLKTHEDRASTPGSLVKSIINKNDKNHIVSNEIKKYQTIYYHEVKNKLKSLNDLKQAVKDESTDFSVGVNDVIKELAHKLISFANNPDDEIRVPIQNHAKYQVRILSPLNYIADSPDGVEVGSNTMAQEYKNGTAGAKPPHRFLTIEGFNKLAAGQVFSKEVDSGIYGRIGRDLEISEDGKTASLMLYLKKENIEKIQEARVQRLQADYGNIEALRDEQNQELLKMCFPGPDMINQWSEVFEKATKQLTKCMGLVTLTTRRRSFDSVNEFNKPEPSKKSMDGKLECKDVGAEGQDYNWCLGHLITYDVFLAEEKASQDIFNNNIAQLKASELATQDPNDPTAALKSQVKVLEMTKDQFVYKAAAQGTKGGALGLLAGLYKAFGEDLHDNCVKELKFSLPKAFFNDGSSHENVSISNLVFGDQMEGKLKPIFYQGLTPEQKNGAVSAAEFGSHIDHDDICAATNQMISAYPNTTMVGKAGAMAIKLAADAVAFGLSISQIEEAISKLNKLIAEIENAVDGTVPENPFADLKQNPCLLDPTIEGCFEAGAGTNFGAGAGNVNIDSPQFGLSGSESVNEKNLDQNNATGDKGGAKGNINQPKVAGVSDNTSRAKGVQDRVGAARIKTNPSSGGGGGGGGGGASAPGLGGGGGGGRGRGGGGGSGYQKREYPLTTGGKGSTRAIFSGGQGLGGSSGKKARRDRNPFAKLAKGKSVDKFRNPAAIGKKGKSIWDTITNRYSDVDRKGRLEKYESR